MSHTYASILLHVVFSTKGRSQTITDGFRARLYEYMAGVIRNEAGHAIRIGGTDDHVHVLLSVRADVAVAEAMRKIKSLSSGWVHNTLPTCADFAWQAGYGAFSVGQSQVARVVAYIDGQMEHHKKRSFEDELIDLLQKYEVPYDPAHVWD